MYTSLHNHTDYSNALLGFPDSINKMENIIQRAYDIGLNGFAITDHEGISCHVKAIKYYNSMQKDRDFKLILGNEIYLLSEQEDINNREKIEFTPYYHFILNALDNKGHEQIRELSTRAWIRAYTSFVMRTPTYYTDIEEVIGDNKGHIIASTACLGSKLDKLILKWKETNDDNYKKEIHQFITWCINVFGKDNFYLEVQPSQYDEETKEIINKEQDIVNQTMKLLSKAYGLKIIATTDSHYYSKESAKVHKTLLDSKEGDREVDSFYATAYLMDSDELRKYLLLQFTDEEINEIFNNTNEICNRVIGYDFEHAPMIPELPEIPNFEIKHIYESYYNKYKEFSYYAHIKNIQDQYFFYRIENALYNLIEKRGKDIETYINRLDKEFKELRLISEAFNSSMASYYVTMSKIIELIWKADSFSMPARGSGAGFLVCYLLEITQIDPVPLGDYFPFWRHLSHERGVEIADIDDDSQSNKRDDIIEEIRNYFGDDRVLNVSTFSGLTSKTAIEKACKGLKISDDTAGYLKSLIPVERGSIWSLNDCFYGNKDKGRKPVRDLISEIEKYDYLKKCIFTFEGLIINRGIHASGILIGNNPYTEQISAIRSPNGVLCSCYDLHDAEYCGWTKVDILTIVASDKIRKTMDLLIEHGHMQWQGSLKDTYWKYLHPDVLEYDNQDMWKMIKQIYSIFQFDTPVSVKALNQVEPKSVMELSATNSLLRLMAQNGQEAPLDKYKRYKTNINEWYNDMSKFGLNEEEQNILDKYLHDSYGLADSQEKVMLISMDEKISGFTLKEANKLRKSIAKKNPKVLEETKKLFYERCEKQKTRKIFADYVWNVVFAMSFGYSFSQLHSYSYSVIALQELNLNYFYPTVYWNTACLTIDSQSDETNERSKNTNYGKVAKSIYKMKKFGVDILPPNINKSDISFTPIEETNEILFGLGGITKVNAEISKQIVDNRPYANFKDFYDKNCYKGSLITKTITMNLIKSGAFTDTDPNIINTMKWFCVYENPPKEFLTASNLDKAIEYKVSLPQDLVRAYRFKKYVINKNFFYCNDPKFKSKKHYIVEPKFAKPYFEKKYIDLLEEEKDYYYDNDNLIVIDKSLEKAMKQEMDTLKEVLKNKDIVDEYNKKMWNKEYINMVKKEDINKWSFDSISFYANGKHELDGVNLQDYNISHFSDLPEEPQFIEKSYGKRKWKQYDISRICGTVLDRNDNNHLVDILTPDNEVVTLNIPQGQYGYYKQTITIGEEKDENWLKRGNLIMVSGYRRNDAFFVKKYKNTIFQHSITLIKEVNEDKTLTLKLERLSKNEEN